MPKCCQPTLGSHMDGPDSRCLGLIGNRADHFLLQLTFMKWLLSASEVRPVQTGNTSTELWTKRHISIILVITPSEQELFWGMGMWGSLPSWFLSSIWIYWEAFGGHHGSLQAWRLAYIVYFVILKRKDSMHLDLIQTWSWTLARADTKTQDLGAFSSHRG